MSKIYIKRFRQIENFEFEIKDLLIFIGPQASGKSTISKLVYYFYTLPISTVSHLFNQTQNMKTASFNVESLRDRLIDVFYGVFGKDDIEIDFEIAFEYDTGEMVELIGSQAGIFLKFSNQIAHQLDVLNKNIDEINTRIDIENRAKNPTSKYIQAIFTYADKVFGNFNPFDYIPAGRMLVSLFRDLTWAYTRDDILDKDTIKLERVVSEFYNRVSRIRNNRADNLQSLDDMELDIVREEFLSKIKRIIKGNVMFKDDLESILYNHTRSIPMGQASSGQQEVLWIILFMINSLSEETSYIVEEPEAHLFPETQKDLLEFMVMYQNITQSKLILTTHSPYILTSLNNLILAKNMAEINPETVKTIIKDYYWVDFDKVGVYYVDNNANPYAIDLLDRELKMIDDSYIDNVSIEINTVFDKLSGLDA